MVSGKELVTTSRIRTGSTGEFRRADVSMSAAGRSPPTREPRTGPRPLYRCNSPSLSRSRLLEYAPAPGRSTPRAGEPRQRSRLPHACRQLRLRFTCFQKLPPSSSVSRKPELGSCVRSTERGTWKASATIRRTRDVPDSARLHCSAISTTPPQRRQRSRRSVEAFPSEGRRRRREAKAKAQARAVQPLLVGEIETTRSHSHLHTTPLGYK